MTPELPLPDYDSLPIGSIESRIRALDAEGLAQVLDHERQHADRPQVVMMLQNRLESLRGGAQPSSGDPAAPAPETASGQSASLSDSPVKEGPPMNPPSQGVPTNPAQPRR